MEKTMQRLFRDYRKLGGKLEYPDWRDWYTRTFYRAS